MSLFVMDPGDEHTYPGRTTKLVCEDRAIIKWPSGGIYVRYLYSNMVEALADDMRRNVTDHYDNILIVTGQEGSGKSTLSYDIAKAYDPDFDMSKGYIYEYNEFLDRVASGEDLGKTFWMDELTNIASNRDWMREDNKSFIQILEMFRSRCWTLIMCIPHIERVDLYLREYRVRYIINVSKMSWEGHPTIDRGYFELLKSVDSSTGSYHQSVGYGRFRKMPDDVHIEYERLKRGSQDRKLDELQAMKKRKQDPYEAQRTSRRLMLKLHNDGYSNADIAEISGKSEQTVANSLTKAKKEAEDV